MVEHIVLSGKPLNLLITHSGHYPKRIRVPVIQFHPLSLKGEGWVRVDKNKLSNLQI